MNMKKYIKYIVSVFLIAGTWGCSDFLDKYPLDKQTEETAFVTYDNFKTYTWGCYNYFNGFKVTANQYDIESALDECNSDNMIYATSNNESVYAYQKKVIPATSSRWSFTYIRKVNVMLQNVDGSAMTALEKDHWRSVGYFFRALYHFDMLKWYGDIPWVDHVITEEDTETLYGPRIDRKIVIKNILDDLKWAEEHIKTDGDGTNTVNKNLVRALISRVALFEGTWQKYHNISDGSAYFDECIRASSELLASQSAILSNYNDKYNSLELKGKAGILLYREYATDILTHSVGRVVRTSAWNYNVTKDAVDSYLCTDGKPISTSSVYDGDQSMYDQFRNRDRRLYFTVIPPYKVAGVNNASTQTWSYTSDPQDREYMDILAGIAGNGDAEKRLPTRNFAGNVTNMSPHFTGYNGGQGFIVCQLGYYFWKYYNSHQTNHGLRTDTEDFPLFTVEEVMLNYAEAACERGQFTQAVADNTINKLRPRAGLPNMTVIDIDATFDTSRDPSVSPLLWEVRRERRVELMGDGFRFTDLKRWKKGEYVNKQPLGAYIKRSDFGNTNNIKILNNASEGYTYYFDVPKGWLDKYYLEPLPTKETTLNPNLLPNNPGWEE